MRIKVSEIGDEGLALDLPVTGTWLATECPDLDARPGPGGIKVRGRLQRMGEDVFLRGQLRGTIQSACARCLETAQVPLDIPLAVTFVDDPSGGDSKRSAAAAAGSGDDDGDDDVDIAHIHGDEIDLGPELRDQILLALPVSPLCSEACLGLCPVCGVNRNQDPCDCETRPKMAASPLAALGKLKI